MRFGNISRRDLLKIGGIGAASLVLPGFQSNSKAPEDPNTAIVRVQQSYVTGTWWFEPAGVYIQKGQKVKWRATTAASIVAFHPSNYNHELRIPENAKPFNSGQLGESENNTFEWTFDVEGTYDYFGRMQESLGMVGRIVVGAPGGPAEQNPPGYGGKEGRAVMFPDEIRTFQLLSSKEIVAKKTVTLPRNLNARTWPYSDR